MAQGRKSTGPNSLSPEAMGLFALIGLVGFASFGTWIAASVGASISGVKKPTGNPLSVLIELATGDYEWPPAATAVLIAELAIVVALVVGVFLLLRRRRGSRSRVDRHADLMSNRRDLRKILREGAQETANRLGAGHAGPGVFIGRTVRDDLELFGSWEDMHIDIWGPRTGKTTTRAVPAILDAPGAVIATSNKRDIVDATRGPRTAKGPVWVFDPQGVADEEPTWWWNPLTYVTSEVKAKQFADHIVNSQRREGARSDAYFDTVATDLLAGLLLAAALAKRPITQVYLWLSDQLNDEPARILDNAPGYELAAQQMASLYSLPDKQRAGVFGSAQPNVQFLLNRQVARWVNPNGPSDNRPQFSPQDFIRRGGTLYSLSKEGTGTAGPLVAALTVAIVEAAEDYAKTCPMGRLPTPLVGVLDEAANVCRWKDLPDLYSHFGSRGIVLMTILQSWAQGVECWGEHGIEKLWSSANIRVYGGGVSDANFLERLSKLIGEYDIRSNSVSYQKGERSHSSQIQRHSIMEVSDLTSMPPGRAIVFASGTPATMIRTIPWMARPDAGAVRASLAQYDPGAASTAGPAGASANPWVAAGQKAQHNPLGPAQVTWPAQQQPPQPPPQQPSQPQQQWGQAQWSPPNPNDRRG
ncbi:Type IV secretory pathway VirD4 protein-like protein [Kribbella flavida DSM 17836]|uniref:Type IV secretory pathway VirD4 protein-like protein n=1 Tax=Kribbella flavida (strain DSM 17836 / JCM 10339 / NBRC 14399) TaxID=479435 RepID=D2Q3V4_KRIFD|nr:TraM recognition domain-containing protein [Kribbella flavida]ADB35976.1 Type IV secretory pathway VirD4 protein-like protein [Kribbella flavida DSM 17836]